MVSTILLGMMDNPFRIFKDYISSNTSELEVINKNAPIFHNLEQALDRYSPDIYLLLMSATKFDHSKQNEIEDEILDTFYKIKSNPKYSNVRLAIQANSKVSNKFLKKLAMLSIWDIFTVEGHAKKINLAKILRQLSNSSNIQNVNQYLENTPNFELPKTKKSESSKKSSIPKQSQKSVQQFNEKNAKIPPSKNVGYKIRKKLIPTLLLLVLGIGILSLSQHSFHHNQKNSIPKYATLLSEGKYSQAARYYPSKAVETETKMLDDQNVEDKGELASKISTFNNSDVISFDKEYFQKNYQDAVEIYEHSEERGFQNLEDSRRIMLAYSLMKTEKFEEARRIAKPLNNSNLNKRINVYEEFYKANKILKVKIKNNELNKVDLKRAQEELRKNQDAMDKL